MEVMKFALSTHWNAFRHEDGRALLQEILEAGFDRVELGYDLTLNLIEGVLQAVSSGSMTVVSVHNYCPVPTGAPAGHPEIFNLSSSDRSMRASAVKNTARTIEFAAKVRAQAVVMHCGYVSMRNLTAKLLDMAQSGGIYSEKFEKIKTKLIMKRGKAADKTMDALRRSIEELLPEAEIHKVKICPENLPMWESVPSEMEMAKLLEEFNSPWLGYWHDMGHGEIRQDLGLSSQTTWARRLKPAGYHIHDMDRAFEDHLMPPHGKIDFSAFKGIIDSDSLLVLEPAPNTPVKHIVEAAKHLENCWSMEGQ